MHSLTVVFAAAADRYNDLFLERPIVMRFFEGKNVAFLAVHGIVADVCGRYL